MAKKKKRMKPIFGVIFIALSAIFVFGMGKNLYRILESKKAYNQLVATKEELEDEKKLLEEQVKKLEDESYVVRYARDHYIFSKNGEEVVKIKKDD